MNPKKLNAEKNSYLNPCNRTWYLTSVATAVVAGLFCLMVCLVLVANYLPQRPVARGLPEDATPLESAEIIQMKETLKLNPDGVLRDRIQELDLQLRRQYFRRLALSNKGAWLLLGGLAVFFIALKSAARLHKTIPTPPSGPPDQTGPQPLQKSARRSVAALAVLLGAAAVALAVFSPPDLTRNVLEATEIIITRPPYPTPEEINANWPWFRGPGGQGIAAFTNIPQNFNAATGENILWKTPVPQWGHSSPVVWEKRVFLSGGTKDIQQVYCFDADTGKLLWQKNIALTRPPVYQSPDIMEDTGIAASTMATDGRRAYAIFANGDVVAFDFEGNQLWAENLGPPDSIYGYASSLAMYQNLLLIQYDQGPDQDDNYQSRLYAFDGATGKMVWRTNRDVYDSWTSPVVIDTGKRKQLIAVGSPWASAYDPANGIELWRIEGFGSDVAPSPIYVGGLVIIVHPNDQVYAVRPDGAGNVTETHIAWTAEEILPETCSPVGNDELVFFLDGGGYLGCYEVKTGQMVWEKDMQAMFLSSPTLVGDKLYLLSDEGVMYIIAAARQYQEIARAELGERASSCPAFTNGRIYIRTEKNLFCIGQK